MTPHVWKNMTSISNTPQKFGCDTNMSGQAPSLVPVSGSDRQNDGFYRLGRLGGLNVEPIKHAAYQTPISGPKSPRPAPQERNLRKNRPDAENFGAGRGGFYTIVLVRITESPARGRDLGGSLISTPRPGGSCRLTALLMVMRRPLPWNSIGAEMSSTPQPFFSLRTVKVRCNHPPFLPVFLRRDPELAGALGLGCSRRP